jgi:hypothetical protein
VRGLLLTQCLQVDFLRPLERGEPLPNLVHVGALEADRLTGPNGALPDFLRAVHKSDPADIGIIHIIDQHDPEKHQAHFDLFKPHCIAGTQGEGFVEPLPELVQDRRGTRVVVGGNLSDAEYSDLESVLQEMAGPTLAETPVGVVGVWTDVKVLFLLYDLATRLGARNLATCSALTASRSLRSHFAALEQIREVLGVSVFHSPGRFLDWLGVPSKAPLRIPETAEANLVASVPTPPSWKAEEIEERDALVAALCPEGSTLHPLGGGFSGAQVFLTRDASGAASVLKVGPRAEIASERFGNERIRRILGDGVPALLGHREGTLLAAMRMELADSADPAAARPMTFKKLFESDPSDRATQALEDALKRSLGDLLGRFYRTAEKDNTDLLEAYGFTDSRGHPCWGDSVNRNAAAIATRSGSDSVEALLASLELPQPWMTPAAFYGEWLPGRSRREEVFSSVVHADLNLANILVARNDADGSLFRTWVIDFARLCRLPNLTDFAKVENDLTFILFQVPDPARLASPLLLPEGLEGLAESELERRYVRLLLTLRRLAAEADPRGAKAMSTYRVALLRYAAHTLGFFEPSLPQLRLALAAVVRLAGLLAAETHRVP